MKEMFRAWILAQEIDNITITEVSEGRFELRSKNALGKVNFYSMNIIELSVDNLNTNDSIFYLHFQLNDLDHAKDLFNELVDCIEAVKEENVHRILLCCTSGLTTGFFASKLNEACELLSLDYCIDAVSIDKIFNVIDQYELICIAPQIAYKLADIKHEKPHANVIKIPPQIFAKYDVGEMLKVIEEKLNKNEEKEVLRPHSYREIRQKHDPILCLNIIRNSRRTHVIYAVYDKNNFVIMNNEVIKPVIYLSDIYDAIDIALASHPDICCVGMSLPGIINKERFISANYVEGLNNHNLDDLFTHKYNKPFVFTNDANAAAVGFYSSHNQYESLSFIYQPLYYRAGIGSVVNGKLLVGAHNLAGEIKLIPIELSKPFMELIQEPGGGLEIITKQIITLMTTIDPEAIVVCSQLVDNIEDIQQQLLQYFDHRGYLPDLIKEDSFHVYLFLGQLILCIESIKNNKEAK